MTEIGGVRVAFPLRDWTDNDVWEFIEENHVPIPENRYENRMDREDTWYNNDHIHACVSCCDPREKASHVYCPKAKKMVANVGDRVLQLHVRPSYIEDTNAVQK
jgi:3'-phosphoadenosine 5'-phosphosulfate sulfotransferase (PAPS reductase)/FAD synthetase